jgi:hypothetical protein
MLTFHMNMDICHVIVIQLTTFHYYFYFIYNYDLVPISLFSPFFLLNSSFVIFDCFDKIQPLPSGHEVIPSNV